MSIASRLSRSSRNLSSHHTMKSWIPQMVLLFFLAWIQLGVTVLLRAPYDHIPIMILFALYAFFSLKNVWGIVLLLSQGALHTLMSASGYMALPMAVVIGVAVLLTLRTVMTHRSSYAVFVVSFLAVLVWEIGLSLWDAMQTEMMTLWVSEWLKVALLSGILVVLLHLLLPRWLRRVTHYIRLPQL